MLNLLFPILFQLLWIPFLLNLIMDSSRATCITRVIKVQANQFLSLPKLYQYLLAILKSISEIKLPMS